MSTQVDTLFRTAFEVPRDPRSEPYKAGVRAALTFRIDGVRIPRLYRPATAEDDAFYAGQAEGHAIWRQAIVGNVLYPGFVTQA
ncbi:hypothetical protein [Pseudoduganella violaceinigra]|uniref:hypothetical protein n=1 Tax=Pseudoduganella violaceinigra TaxID=246602 RepID=UPI00041A0037|nr:hypothetical protein [Pseudoduganella violaceinigra]